jgi:hypothetical protein
MNLTINPPGEIFRPRIMRCKCWDKKGPNYRGGTFEGSAGRLQTGPILRVSESRVSSPRYCPGVVGPLGSSEEGIHRPSLRRSGRRC